MNTPSGRMANIKIATVRMPPAPSATRSAMRTSAASSTNNRPISMTVSCSLNAYSSRQTRNSVLPTTRPAAMTAAMPLSGVTALDTWNSARTSESVSTVSRPSGTSRRTRNSSAISAPPTSPNSPPTPRRISAMSGPFASCSPVGASAISRATSATTAPTASPNTPSASSTVPTECSTRRRRSSGVITVGPVTMTSVPNSTDGRHAQPSTKCAASVPPMALVAAPSVMSARMDRPSRRMRRRSRLSAPSNRMTATAKFTSVNSAGPSVSGWTIPATSGPSSTPVTSKSTMPGMPRCVAMICASMPAASATATVNAGFPATACTRTQHKAGAAGVEQRACSRPETGPVGRR